MTLSVWLWASVSVSLCVSLMSAAIVVLKLDIWPLMALVAARGKAVTHAMLHPSVLDLSQSPIPSGNIRHIPIGNCHHCTMETG